MKSKSQCGNWHLLRNHKEKVRTGLFVLNFSKFQVETKPFFTKKLRHSVEIFLEHVKCTCKILAVSGGVPNFGLDLHQEG
jgi:hypothetical protein